MTEITVHEKDPDNIDGYRWSDHLVGFVDADCQLVPEELGRKLEWERKAIMRANRVARLDAVDRVFASMGSNSERAAAVDWLKQQYRL